MSLHPAVIVAVAIGVAIWLFLRWSSARPEFPPLRTSPNDPLMKAALLEARASMDQFMKLVRAPKTSTVVKLYFVSDSKQVEHLWAEVLEVLDDRELGVRLVTPPVTHSGRLDRVYRCGIEDVEDWQVRDPQGNVHGGFTQRAMFAIARRDGVRLPKELLAIEHEYRDAVGATRD